MTYRNYWTQHSANSSARGPEYAAVPVLYVPAFLDHMLIQEHRHRCPSCWFTPTRCPAESLSNTAGKTSLTVNHTGHNSSNGWAPPWCDTRDLERFTLMPTRHPTNLTRFTALTSDVPTTRSAHPARHERLPTSTDHPRDEDRKRPSAEIGLGLQIVDSHRLLPGVQA